MNNPLLYLAAGGCIVCTVVSGVASKPTAFQIAGALFGASYCIQDKSFKKFQELKNQQANLVEKIELLQQQISNTEKSLQLKQREHQCELERLTAEHQEQWQQREAELLTQQQEIEKLAKTEQERLQESIEAANEELQQDKEDFLKEQAEVTQRYESKLELLESELDELRSLLAQYEAPALPEGSSFEIVIARRCMELLLRKRVVCEFKGAAVDEQGFVVARLKPTDGGQKVIEKWANHLHIEMDLAEAPKFQTLRGAVQVWLKPQEMVRLPAVAPFDLPPGEAPPNLRLVKSEALPETIAPQRVQETSTEFDERLERFVEPSAKLPPYGAIRQIERDWVGFLWIYHDPPIRNQKHIILRVYGYKSGDGDGFQSARSRLHTILKDAGITPRTWNRRGTDEQ
ncbi:hypothetical protein [Coleofasciculus sp. FACHB-501]|uniref:hypothetical protein n=1 Tax=Cyanophyceae TaxID=3028117 RepID=UPI001682AE1A|nr:hypothetical protein [Coleofasciculus sp. FACHB-501]MBD1836654.1 hypothetical protein [Coleofasciculus sp. FACHB-501]